MNTLTTINQDLRLMYVDGQSDLQKEITKQLEYHQTQNSANINWRLERFQHQVLKDIDTIILPLRTAIEDLRTECNAQTQQVNALSQDLASLKSSMHAHVTTSQVSSSSQPSPVTIVHDVTKESYPLQSTMQPGLPDRSSRGLTDTLLPRDISQRYAGNSPIKLDFPSFGRKEDDPDL